MFTRTSYCDTIASIVIRRLPFDQLTRITCFVLGCHFITVVIDYIDHFYFDSRVNGRSVGMLLLLLMMMGAGSLGSPHSSRHQPQNELVNHIKYD